MRVSTLILIFSLIGFIPAPGWAQTTSKSAASRSKTSKKKKRRRRARKPTKKPNVERGYGLIYGGGGGLFTTSPGQQKAGALDFGVGVGLPHVGLLLGGTGAFFEDKSRAEGQVYFDVKILGRDTGHAEPFFLLGAGIGWNWFDETRYTGGAFRTGLGVDFRATPQGNTDWDVGLGLKAVYSISASPYPDSYSVQHQVMLMANLLVMYLGDANLMRR